MATFDETQSTLDNTAPLRPVAISQDALDFATKNGTTEGDVKDPYTSQIMGAAFRSSNTVGSALASEIIAERMFPTKASPALTPEGVVTRLTTDGLLPVAGVFDGVKTVAQYDAAKSQVEREYRDRQILDASGWTGAFANIGASILDLPSLVPVGGEAIMGARLAKAGLSTFARASVRAGVAGAEQATASELGLHASQVTRTTEESVMNVGGSFVLGGLLHFGASAVVGKFKAATIHERVAQDMLDAQAGSPKARSMGAAVNEAYLSTAGMNRVGSLGFDQVLKNVDLPVRHLPLGVGEFMHNALRNPVLDTLDARSPLARRTIQELVNNPWPLEENVHGVASPVSVVDHIGEYKGAYADWAYNANKAYNTNKKDFANYEDFGKRVYSAMINGDVDTQGHAAVTATAKLARERVFEPIRDELIKQGRLPADWNSATAMSYVGRHWNREAIRANEGHVKSLFESHFSGVLKGERDQAQIGRDIRNSEVDAQRTAASDLAKADTAKAKELHKAEAATLNERMATLQARHGHLTAKTVADLRTERMRAESQAQRTHDGLIAEHRTSRDEMLGGGGLTAKDKAAYRQQFKDEVAKEGSKLAVAFDKIKREHQGSTTKKGGVIKGKVANAIEDLNARHDTNLTPHKEALRTSKANREESIAAARDRRDVTNAQIAKDNPTVTHRNMAQDDHELESQATVLASKVFDTLSGRSNTGLHLDYEISAGTAGDHLKGRKVMIPDSVLAAKGYISTNIFHILERYTKTAGTDAAMGKTFTVEVLKIDPATGKPIGPDAFETRPDVGMKKRIADIRAEYDTLIGAENGVKKKDGIEAERNRVLNSLQSIHDIHRGKYLLGVSNPLANKMAESLGIVNFLRAMGGTVISSLSDPFNLVMAHGLGATFRNGIAPMIRDFHAAYWAGDSALRKGSRLAAANMEWVLSDRVAQMAEMHSTDGSDKSLAFMRNAARSFSFLAGITQWNDLLKQVAYNVSQARVIEHAREGWGRVGSAERTWLATLGIDQKTLEGIAEQHAAQPADTQKAGGMLVGDWTNWQDKALAHKFASAMDRESANAIITPQVGDRPLSAHTPAGRAIFQFRGFMISTHSRVLGRNIALANVGAKDGEYGRATSVMTGIAGLVLMGGLIDGMKQAMSHNDNPVEGSKRYLDHLEKNPGAALYDALDRSSLLGPVFEYSNILGRLNVPNGRSLLSAVAHDKTNTVSGKANMFAMSPEAAIGGPSFGLIEDLWGAARGTGSEAAQWANPEWSKGMSRQQAQHFRRLFPGQNIPGIQQGVNMLMDHLGTENGWAPQKPSYSN